MFKFVLSVTMALTLLAIPIPAVMAADEIPITNPRIDITLGQKYRPEKLPYKFLLSDEGTKGGPGLDVYLHSFAHSADKTILIGVDRTSRTMVFFMFKPINLELNTLIEAYGQEFTVTDTGIVYESLGIFAEITPKSKGDKSKATKVYLVGRFLVLKDI